MDADGDGYGDSVGYPYDAGSDCDLTQLTHTFTDGDCDGVLRAVAVLVVMRPVVVLAVMDWWWFWRWCDRWWFWRWCDRWWFWRWWTGGGSGGGATGGTGGGATGGGSGGGATGGGSGGGATGGGEYDMMVPVLVSSMITAVLRLMLNVLRMLLVGGHGGTWFYDSACERAIDCSDDTGVGCRRRS